MSFIRKIKRKGRVYLAEVENRWVNGKVVQRHIRLSVAKPIAKPYSPLPCRKPRWNRSSFMAPCSYFIILSTPGNNGAILAGLGRSH